MSPPARALPAPRYLHAGLGEPDTQRQLLAHEDVGVVGLGEAPLQLVELCWGEARPVALLLLLALLLAGLTRVRPALGAWLLVGVLGAHRQRGRRRTHGGDVLPGQQSGSLHGVGIGSQVPRMAPGVGAPHAQPTLHRLPVAQKLGGIFHT